MSEITIAVVSPIIGAVVYFTGFCYLYSYFGFFGIAPLEVDLSIQYVFVHAFSAYWGLLANFNMYVLFGLAAFALVGAGYFWWLSRVPDQGSVTIPMVIFGTVALLVTSYLVGIHSGSERARQSLDALKLITLNLKKDANITFLPQSGKARLRHILTTDDTIYVLDFSGDGDDFWTFRIPVGAVEATSIYMD